MNAGNFTSRLDVYILLNIHLSWDWRTEQLNTVVVISEQSEETSDPIDRLSAGYMDRHIAHYCRRSSAKERHLYVLVKRLLD